MKEPASEQEKGKEDTQSVEQSIRNLLTAAWALVDLAKKDTLQPGFERLTALLTLAHSFQLVGTEIDIRMMLQEIELSQWKMEGIASGN